MVIRPTYGVYGVLGVIHIQLISKAFVYMDNFTHTPDPTYGHL